MQIQFKVLAPVLLINFFALNISGQTFQKTYGAAGEDQAQYVMETPNGYLIAGSATALNSSQPDAYLFEIDKQGDLLWQRSYGGPLKDIFMGVIPANDGGYVAIGETWSFGQGQQDLFVVKLDLAGQVVWCKTFGGVINDYARSILAVSDGYILSGPQYSMGAGGLDAYFIRLDNQGNVKYSKTVGSSMDDQIQAVYLKDNVLYAGGGVSGSGSFLTLDANTCNVLSISSYGGSGTEALYRCLPTPDGNFILADHTWSTTGSTELRQWAMKVKPDGNQIWSKVYGFPGSNFRGGIENVPNGGFIMTPWDFANPTSTDGMLVRIDDNGKVMWANRYGGNDADRFFKSIPTSDGGFISVGHTRSFGAGSDDIFVVKTDAAGLVTYCCPKSLAIESQDFNAPLSSPALTVGSFASAQNWPLQTKDIAPFIFENCSTDLPKGTRQINLCSQENFTINGKAYLAPAVVFDTIPSAFGCDSAIEYRLIPLPLNTASRSATICPGGSVTLYGTTYTQPGLFKDTIPASVGCDTALTVAIFTQNLVPLTRSATICPGTSVTLNGITYTQPGIYSDTLTATGSGCDTLLTVTIIQNADTLFIPEKHSLCAGDTLVSHGAKITQAGTYHFQEPSLSACVLIHRVEVELVALPVFVLGIAPSGCDGKPIGSIEVNGPQPGWQARLDGGDWTTTPIFEKLPPARYVVSVRNAQGCVSHDTVQVPETSPFLLKIRLDTAFAECGLLTATASHSSQLPVRYEWSPATGVSCPTCPMVELRPEQGQVYRLLAVDSAGCRAMAEVVARAEEIYHIYAPNVFSPNDDGHNDRFTLYGSRCARLIRRFGIYDRWGGLVFYRENLPLSEEAGGWDGYARNQIATPGVFTWWADVELHSGRQVKLKGSVTVVR